MQTQTYQYLVHVLSARQSQPVERCSHEFLNGFVPAHLSCHLTTMQVAVELGWVPVVGVEFLDLNGKLYPWPHMVNRSPRGLVDFSPPVDQPRLGFFETGWSEFHEWRMIIADYNEMQAAGSLPSWGDPLADELTDEFMPALAAAALAFRS